MASPVAPGWHHWFSGTVSVLLVKEHETYFCTVCGSNAAYQVYCVLHDQLIIMLWVHHHKSQLKGLLFGNVFRNTSCIHDIGQPFFAFETLWNEASSTKSTTPLLTDYLIVSGQTNELCASWFKACFQLESFFFFSGELTFLKIFFTRYK